MKLEAKASVRPRDFVPTMNSAGTDTTPRSTVDSSFSGGTSSSSTGRPPSFPRAAFCPSLRASE